MDRRSTPHRRELPLPESKSAVFTSFDTTVRTHSPTMGRPHRSRSRRLWHPLDASDQGDIDLRTSAQSSYCLDIPSWKAQCAILALRLMMSWRLPSTSRLNGLGRRRRCPSGQSFANDSSAVELGFWSLTGQELPLAEALLPQCLLRWLNPGRALVSENDSIGALHRSPLHQGPRRPRRQCPSCLPSGRSRPVGHSDRRSCCCRTNASHCSTSRPAQAL